MGAEQGCNLGLDGLRQQRSRAVAQNLGQRISKSSWLAELENVSVGHGVSLLRWRSGGSNNPHDTPPYLNSSHWTRPGSQETLPQVILGLIQRVFHRDMVPYLAASAKATVGRWVLYDIQLPPDGLELASLLRASGRLFWPGLVTTFYLPLS
jgi:hypothetical protein